MAGPSELLFRGPKLMLRELACFSSTFFSASFRVIPSGLSNRNIRELIS